MSSITFQADPEHGALRSAIFGLFFVLWVVGYILINAVIPSDGFNIIGVVVGFGLAAVLVSQVIEPYLRRSWPSGRTLHMDANSIRLVHHDKVQKTINTQEPMSILLWNFKIKHRRNRVPAGWFVMACALEQNEDYLPVYALVSPEQAKALEERAHFTTLISDRDAKAKDVRQDTLRVTGEQRRLRLAETFRWADGAELTYADFEQFLQQLNTLYPQWMPLNHR
ncbi:MAG: hypothetical protein HZC41_20900 [Chloroflexi bacterium]|nr:hypothetical protein [Chloroflexota bacterium]